MPESATVRRYIQCEVLFDTDPVPHDGVASAEYVSLAARQANRSAAEYHRIMRQDEELVFDTLIVNSSFIGSHHVLTGPGTGPYKVVRFLKRDPAVPPGEFAPRWRDHHAPQLIEAWPEMLSYAQNVAVGPESPRGWGLDVDGSEELWFAAPEPAIACARSAALRQLSSTLFTVSACVVTVPASGGTYWVGEAMQKVDYNDAGPKRDTTGAATKTLAANAATSRGCWLPSRTSRQRSGPVRRCCRCGVSPSCVTWSHCGNRAIVNPRQMVSVAPLGLIAVLALAACSGADARADAAAGTAQRLLTAVQAGDGAAACALLAPDTANEVGQSSGRSCPDVIGGVDLPGPAAVRRVEVYGQHAEVAVAAPDGDGTLFLALFPGGWRVVAAGCRPQGERPYDCTVQGG
nr:hypothetical protein GCM10020063_042360 [Dactylosporangium thailandense]